MTEQSAPVPEGSPAEPAEADTKSHDIPMSDELKAAIAQDWDPAPAMPHPARPDGAAFTRPPPGRRVRGVPGQLVVVPAGACKTRANDTDYPFRAASSFTWLTGETVADAVLVMTPTRPGTSAPSTCGTTRRPGDIAYFTSRMHGALWVGNVPSLADTAAGTRLGHPAAGRTGARPGGLARSTPPRS